MSYFLSDVKNVDVGLLQSASPFRCPILPPTLSVAWVGGRLRHPQCLCLSRGGVPQARHAAWSPGSTESPCGSGRRGRPGWPTFADQPETVSESPVG